MVRDFSDQVVVVTGAAGTLGHAAARAYLQTGAHLVIVGSDEQRLEDRFPELIDRSDHMLAAPVDLADVESVGTLASQVKEKFGRADILLNIAGGFRSGNPVHELDPDEWETVMSMNARTALLTSRAFLPLMLEHGRGQVVNIGARPGLKGRAGMAPYAASKSAVLRLTESISAEVKDHGVNVNCIIPGTIDTPGNRESMPEADFSRWVQPEALVDIMMFLTSDEARALHGAIIPAYGLT